MQSSKRKKIAIFGGTGAVGAYFSMSFVYGCPKCLFCDLSIIGESGSASLNHARKYGIQVHFNENNVSRDLEILPRYVKYLGEFDPSIGLQDLVIVSLKQPSITSKVAAQIRQITDKNSIVGVVSNGLPFYFLRGLNLPDNKYINSIDKNGEISQILGDRNIIGIQPTIMAGAQSPGRINIMSPLEKVSVTIGSPYESSTYQMIPTLSFLKETATMLNQVGINTTVVIGSFHRYIIERLAVNMVANVISAIVEQSVNKTLDHFIDSNISLHY